MITLVFDEYGKFEEGEVNDSTLSLIAGFLYDDMDVPEEKKHEEKRIAEYLKQICAEAGVEYPKGMHYDEKSDIGRASAVSALFRQSIHEFLTEGKYKGVRLTDNTRLGYYTAFAYVRSGDGKKSFMQDSVGLASRDDRLSNLYIHMANDVINRTIFSNPYKEDIDGVFFDLPTRSYAKKLGLMNGDLKNNYINLAYDNKQTEAKRMNDVAKDIISVTDGVSFRSAIEREVFHSNKQEIEIEGIRVRSLDYRTTSKTRIRESGFLYLSDLLCDAVHYGIAAKERMRIPDRLHKLVGENSMVFYYDDIDTIFSKALESMKKGFLYETLELIYDGYKSDSQCRDYYVKKWFSFLLEELSKKTDAAMFSHAVTKLKAYSRKNNLEQEKLIFLTEKLSSIAEIVDMKTDAEKAVLFDYYQTAATAYNHIADTRSAKKNLKEAEKYSRYVSLETRLEMTNKEAVSLCDELDYEKAVSVCENAQKAWDGILELRNNLYGESDISDAARKAYSQLGQVYAFADDSRAEYSFSKAIGEGKSPNNMISLSYLLHHYAEQGNVKRFERAARTYFGDHDDLNDRLDYLIREGSKGKEALISLKFALYVYVRGTYLFRMEDVVKDKKLQDRLMNIEQTIEGVSKEGKKEINGHPWELIYKYLALIALDCGNEDVAKAYIKKTEIIPRQDKEVPEHLLMAIIDYGKVEYLAKRGNYSKATLKKAIDACWGEIISISDRLSRKYKDPKTRSFFELKQLMFYMYH